MPVGKHQEQIHDHTELEVNIFYSEKTLHTLREQWQQLPQVNLRSFNTVSMAKTFPTAVTGLQLSENLRYFQVIRNWKQTLRPQRGTE